MNISRFYNRRITVARVYGIPVRIDYRWFAVFALSVWLIATNLIHRGMWVFQLRILHLDSATGWIVGIITTMGLFISVFGHELSHALVGRAEGIEIEEILLHPFGGLARLRSEPHSPGAEFRIAVAGPAASFIFAVFSFAATVLAMMGKYPIAAAVFFLIGSGNLLLAVFNLFPGYPLDGGRVLRAILWHKSGNITQATRMAGVCGMLIAAMIILFGIYIMIAPNWRASQPYFMGVWSILVGIFLLDTATKVVKSAQGAGMVLTAGEAMQPSIAIEPETTVCKLIDEILPLHRQTTFPVALNRRLHGILSLEDLKSLPRERWRITRARDVMRPIAPGFFVEPSTTLEQARKLMDSNGVGSLAVIDANGDLLGFLQSGKLRRRQHSPA
jgi:Zn-dependent protease/CBS domain-containing protein